MDTLNQTLFLFINAPSHPNLAQRLMAKEAAAKAANA
jgi:hypothetical protein